MNINLNNTDNNDYVRGFKDGKRSGATEWAGKAQELIDVLELAKKEIQSHYKRNANHYVITAIDNALAKYNEVSNG
jgi:hypothetical protein